jgi:hypothetical protein
VRAAALVGVGLLAGLVSATPSSQKVGPATARELLGGVCTTGVASGACTPCPAFTSTGQAGYGQEGLTPTSVIYGKFSDPKRTDALLDVSGCEPHAGNYGGSLLLRWRGLTSWKQTRYVAGYRTGHCLKYPAPDGRELLLCQGDYYGMGTAVQSLILLDINHADPMTQNLLSTYDTTDACLADGSIQSLLGWKALPGGRYPGLRITVRSARYTRPHNVRLPDDPCATPLSATPSRVYTLDYTYDGVTFRLKPASRPALAALRRDNPYLLGN